MAIVGSMVEFATSLGEFFTTLFADAIDIPIMLVTVVGIMIALAFKRLAF